MSSTARGLVRTYAVADLAAPAPRKRGRPPGIRNTMNQTGQPPAKKSKVVDNIPITTSSMRTTADNDSDVEMPVSPLPKRTARHQIDVPARSPLPARFNHITNPGAPDQRRARRMSAEVAAANKAKMDLKQRLEQLE